MEIINLLTGQPAAVALAILAMYWLNRNNLEFAREKREIIEIIRAERKEWLDEAREQRRQLIEIQRTSTEAETKNANELHALRNQIAPALLALQQFLARTGHDTPRGPGGGDRNDTN